jgi:CheY-like chemotaxis protein
VAEIKGFAMHALTIEDELLTALDLKGILQELGFESVELATCEEDAVEAARRHRPDFITADIRLQQGAGDKALAIIQNELGPIPAIYVTASQKIRKGVPSALLVTKPFTKKTIHRAWQTACYRPNYQDSS